MLISPSLQLNFFFLIKFFESKEDKKKILEIMQIEYWRNTHNDKVYEKCAHTH